MTDRTRQEHSCQLAVIRRSRLLGAVVALLCAGTTSAQLNRTINPPTSDGTPLSADRVTQVRVMPDRPTIAPGETFHVAVLFEISRDWHLYWKNPGAGAMAPDVELSVPDGFEVGAIRWPRPMIMPSSVGEMYGYEDRFMLLIPVRAPDTVKSDRATITLDIAWAVCEKDMCLFGRKSVETAVRIGESASGTDEKIHPLVRDLRSTFPVAADEDANTSARVDNGTLILEGPANGRTTAGFIPHSSPGVEYDAAEIELRDDRFVTTIPLTITPLNFEGGPPRIGGVVILGESPDDPSYEFTTELPQKRS